MAQAKLGDTVKVHYEGKLENGTLEYLGEPGEIDNLDSLQREITDGGGMLKNGKGKAKKFVKTWLADVSARPIKAKKVTVAVAVKSAKDNDSAD